MLRIAFRIYTLLLLVFGFGIGREMLALTADQFSEEGVSTIVSMVASLVIVLLTLFLLFHYREQVRFMGFSRLIVFWTLFIIFPVLLNKQPPLHFIRVEIWAMSFLLVYILVRRNPNYIHSLATLFVLLFFIGLVFFIQSKLQLSEFKNEGLMARSNVIYNVLLTFPWILLLKKNKYKFVLLAILSLSVLYSGKRSTVLVLILSILPLLYTQSKNIRSRWLRAFLFGGLLAVMLGGFMYVNARMDNLITDRFESIEDDQGSGRLPIYEHVWRLQNNSSTLEWIFGHGHYAVKKDSYFEMSAHNDVLEVLYDYGIIVLLLYVCIYYFLIRRLIYLYRIKLDYFTPYYMSVVIFIVMSMVSHLILYSTYFIYLSMFWGAIEALYYRQKLHAV